MRQDQEHGVVLPAGHTGSSLFHRVLLEAVEAFPEALTGVGMPEDPREFKRGYAELLVRFEAARGASDARVEIARHIAQRTQDHVLLSEPERSAPLEERLAERAPRPALSAHELAGAVGLRPAVPFEGRTHQGREIVSLCESLAHGHQMSAAALAAVRWIIDHIEAQGGVLSLAGERFALMGAGAELAATPLLLAAGADVLWVDISDPTPVLAQRQSLAGRLWCADAADDLLRRPREVAAAISAFAEEGPVHVGMFAYAAGESREWRLGAAMNAVARSLEPEAVRSVSLFVSPTTAANVQPEDARGCAIRLAEAPGWHSMLRSFGVLPTPGHYSSGGRCVSRSIVSIQGLSYQAAQYISKICAAESYAVFGLSLDGEAATPVTVSANVAGITSTRSLSHPLFEAAFVGAPAFGVRIFDPDTTRALGGLLMLHDLLNPEAPGSRTATFESPREKADRTLSQQVHGGLYSLPYVLEPAIRAAALLGLARRPGVLFPSRAASA